MYDKVLIPTKAIYNIHLELGKHLQIYAACFALSLVNLCHIPYESLVMLSKSRLRTYSSSYMHYSYTGSKHQQTPHRITLVFNVLSSCYYLSNHLFKGYMWLKEEKGVNDGQVSQ